MTIQTSSPARCNVTARKRATQNLGDLRVAIVSDAIAGRNGVGTYYLDLIEHIQSHVAAIELLSPAPRRDPASEQYTLPMPGDPTQRISWPRRDRIREQLDSLSPHLVLIPSIGPFSYCGLNYARKNAIPIAVINHTSFDKLMSLYWPAVVARPLSWALTLANNWMVRQASHVAAVNQDAFEQVSEIVGRQMRVMGTPVSREFLDEPVAERRQTVQRVVYVGRLAAEKGIVAVLNAAAQLPDLEFSIIGDGPERRRVERAAARQSNVEFWGWLPRHLVREEMDRSDLLVLPSAFESFGTVALEALSRQRHVLVSRQCGIANWPAIAPGLFYIEPSEDLAGAIDRIAAFSFARRDETSEIAWSAVQDFNQQSIQGWLDFFAVVSGAASVLPRLFDRPGLMAEVA